MIGYIRGDIKFKDKEGLIVDCAGVGYSIRAPLSILRNGEVGEPIELYIHTHVREDVLALYGFLEMESLRLFEKIIGVSGIGPKTALVIFDKSENVEAIRTAIIAADVDFFTKIPGIGKKGAQKVIIELKPKLGSDDDLDLRDNVASGEVMQAMLELGFKKNELRDVLKKIDSKLPVEEQIKQALRYV